MAAPSTRVRAYLLGAGAIVTTIWLLLARQRPHGTLGDLHSLVIVFSIIVAALLLAEALDVASPALEVLFGLIAGWLGVKAGGPIDVLALMGSSALMFLVGLEIDLEFVRANLGRSVLVGVASFLAPLALTTVILYALGGPLFSSLLVGVAVSTTSVAVVYSIVKTSIGVKTSWGQLALASAMVADVASIVAFTALITRASKSLAAYIIALVAAPPLLRRLLRGLPELGYEGEVRIIIALLLAATLASEIVGIHAVLASFILGLALQEFANAQPVRDKIEALVTGFLAPVFFVAAGIQASAAEPLGVALISALLLLASYPAKVASVLLLLGDGEASRRIAYSFGARLTVSTLIAYVGVERGLLSVKMAGAVMLSAVIATLTSGILAREREPLFEA